MKTKTRVFKDNTIDKPIEGWWNGEGINKMIRN